MHEAASGSIVITGASTGIGAACALELARLGRRVFAGVRNEEDGVRLQDRAAEHAAAIQPLLLDITEAAGVEAAVQRVAAEVGEAGLGGLVNNAGIVVAGPLEILPLDALRRQFDVNLFGTLAVTRAFLPLLRRARGRVVNVGSVNGALSPPYLGAYAASKHAMEAVSDSLRVELRRWGIDVVLVEPGPTRTPIWKKSAGATDLLAAQVSPDRLALYEADLAAMRETVEDLTARSMPVERVALAVVAALTARRPRTRYYITWESRLSFKGLRMLPDRFRDWLVRRALGLK